MGTLFTIIIMYFVARLFFEKGTALGIVIFVALISAFQESDIKLDKAEEQIAETKVRINELVKDAKEMSREAKRKIDIMNQALEDADKPKPIVPVPTLDVPKELDIPKPAHSTPDKVIVAPLPKPKPVLKDTNEYYYNDDGEKINRITEEVMD